MPRLTRWFIKASLLYLILSLALAAWLAAGQLGWLLPAGLSPIFFHFFLVGWVTQVIFGVAYWMLPKYSRAQPRRSEAQAWAVFWLLNIGLALRGLAEPLVGQADNGAWGTVLVLAALLQWLAGLIFVINSWGRVKER